jgi:hypothetical protein
VHCEIEGLLAHKVVQNLHVKGVPVVGLIGLFKWDMMRWKGFYPEKAFLRSIE